MSTRQDQFEAKLEATKALQSDKSGNKTLSQHDLEVALESTSLTELQYEALSHVLDDCDKSLGRSLTEELAVTPPSLLSHTRLPTALGAQRIGGRNVSLGNNIMSEQHDNRAEAVPPPLLTAREVEEEIETAPVSIKPISVRAEIMQDPEPVWKVLIANRKCQLGVVLLVFLIIGLIVFAVEGFVDGSSPVPAKRTPEVQTGTPSMTMTMTRSPTTRSPTTSPTQTYTFRSFLTTVLPSSSLDALAVEESPQQRALAWINSDARNWTNSRRLQRWTLYVIYESLRGASWNSSQGWLTETAECSWEHVTCEGENVVALSLNENGLEGRISEELGLLTYLESLDLGLNALSGSLPSALSGLSNFLHFRLIDNDLTGTFPSVLMNLKNLTTFDAANNFFRDVFHVLSAI
jgi:Leucine-rich repeat (LRR) protein